MIVDTRQTHHKTGSQMVVDTLAAYAFEASMLEVFRPLKPFDLHGKAKRLAKYKAKVLGVFTA